MDFRRVNLQGLGVVEKENGSSIQSGSNIVANNSTKGHGSGFHIKQERSGSDGENPRSSKAARTDDLGGSKNMMQLQGTSLLRSNSVLSGESGQTMLSFSSPKTEVPLLSANVGERTSQSPAFPFYHQAHSYTGTAGCGTVALSAGMNGPFARFRGPFTPAQWMELEQQALIYKYIVANVPIPSNLLIPLRRSLNPFPFSGSSSGSYVPNSFGWGSFHLGLSGNTDPEPGRCRRTDGKKWRCSRDAVADQKYCERHINRGRHRSRKPVEGQTGHAVSGSTSSKVAPIASILSASGMSGSGTSNSLGAIQHFKSLQPSVTANLSTDSLINRMQDPQGLSMTSSSINLKSKDSPFSIPKQHVPFEQSSTSELAFVSSDSLINPSQKISYISSKNCDSFSGFSGQDTDDQHPLRHFMDDCPNDQSGRATVAWPEELKPDWTQLSMSIPMASDFSSSSNSPPHPEEKLTLSPLRLSREFDTTPMGLRVSSELRESTNKQTNWIPTTWGNPVGGPLGEVLNSTTSHSGAGKSSSALNLMTEMWNSSPQLGSSPTGVLQKTTFVSLSNSTSSGSSPTGDNKKTFECAAGLYDDVLGSTIVSSSSIP